MKKSTMLIIAGLFFVGLIHQAGKDKGNSETSGHKARTIEVLKKNAPICKTKEQMERLILNRDDKAYLNSMFRSGQCFWDLGGEEYRVEVLEGMFSVIKIKIETNNPTAPIIGWTDNVYITEKEY